MTIEQLISHVNNGKFSLTPIPTEGFSRHPWMLHRHWVDVCELQGICRNVMQRTTWIVMFLYSLSIFAHINFALRKCNALQCRLHELIRISR